MTLYKGLDGKLLKRAGGLVTTQDCCCDTCTNPDRCGDCCISEDATVTVTWSTSGALPETCLCLSGPVRAGAYSGTLALPRTGSCGWSAEAECGGLVSVSLSGSGWDVGLTLDSNGGVGATGNIGGDCCGASGTVSGSDCDGDAATMSFTITVTDNGCCYDSGTTSCIQGGAGCDGACT